MSQLWQRNFILYSVGVLFSSAGSPLSTIASAALVYQQTGSTSDIALLLAIGAGCSLVAPYAGRYIDRSNIRMILFYTDIMRAVALFAFCAVTYFHTFKIEYMYAYVFVGSILGVVYRPTTGAFMPKLVGRENIARANSVMGLIYRSTKIMGYFIGGLLVFLIGVLPCLVINALTFAIMGFVFLGMDEKKFHIKKDKKTLVDHKKRSSMDVVREMVDRRIIAIPLVVITSAMAFAPYQTEWPRMLSSQDGGIFFALYSLGRVISSIAVYRYAHILLNARYIRGAILVLPVITLLPSYVTNTNVILLSGMVMGACAGVVGNVVYSVYQIAMPTDRRGEMFGIMQPMETFPLVFLYFIFQYLTKNYPYEYTFMITSIILAFNALIISVFFLQQEEFDNARMQSS